MNFLDNPALISMVFYPRKDVAGNSRIPGVVDGTIPIKDDVALGYRLYPVQKENAPVILYFHGNGEIASDYDSSAVEFHHIGASLLVVDYRGYGWSTGNPLVSALMSDVEYVHKALPDILKGLGNGNRYVMGRSLGSVPAIQIASQYPDRFKGLIIESGFANGLKWLMGKGILSGIAANMPDPIGNEEKLKTLNMPLLVIHGERDNLITVDHGKALYDASPAQNKRFLQIRNAGHNDLLLYGIGEYFEAIKTFINS